jgi:hypothetical protein
MQSSDRISRFGWFSERARRLFEGFKARFELGLDKMIFQAGLAWDRMVLSRLLHGVAEWSVELAIPFLPVLTERTGIASADIWAFLKAGEVRHPLLLELAACDFYRPTQKDLRQLSALIRTMVPASARWTHVGRLLPPWLFPEECHPFCARALLRDLNLKDKSVATGWLEWWLHLHEQYFPVDADALVPIRGTVFIPQGDLLATLSGRSPLDLIDDFDLGNCIDAVTRYLPQRGGKFGLLADPAGSPQDSPLAALRVLDNLLIVDDRFVLKRDRGSAVWAACARTGHPLHDRFLDGQIELLGRLKRLVIRGE